jgi:Fic family protein
MTGYEVEEVASLRDTYQATFFIYFIKRSRRRVLLSWRNRSDLFFKRTRLKHPYKMEEEEARLKALVSELNNFKDFI